MTVIFSEAPTKLIINLTLSVLSPFWRMFHLTPKGLERAGKKKIHCPLPTYDRGMS
jgi:hypothetical protein